MAHLIGRGRYARESYPEARRAAAGGACATDYAFAEPISIDPEAVAPYVQLTGGTDFMFPDRQEFAPALGTPLQIGDYVVAAGEALKVEWDLASQYSIFAGPQTEEFVVFYEFAIALLVGGVWNIMDGDYVTREPFANDRGSVYVGPVTDFEPLFARGSGVVIFRPPPATYRIGIYVNEVSVSQDLINGQFTFGQSLGTPKLAAHKIAADCVLDAYDVTDLIPLTPGNVPWSNPG